jgi:hypothetical protein
MTVMGVFRVGMIVVQRRVGVRMRVRLTRRIVRGVRMLVVLVVGMPVVVVESFVPVGMAVALGAQKAQARHDEGEGTELS